MHEIEPQRRIFVGYDERETLSASDGEFHDNEGEMSLPLHGQFSGEP